MKRLPRPVAALLGITAATALLCAAALWNGYPLLFPDTTVYLSDGNAVVHRLLYGRPIWPANGRPIYYGLAAWPFHLEVTLWPVVVVQTALTAWIIALTLRCCGVWIGWPGLVVLIGAMSVLTPLSWYASHIMPDAFTGLLALCLILLCCFRDRLSGLETVILIVLATACITFHVVHLLVGLALLATAVAGWLAFRAARRWLRPVLVGIPVLAGLVALLLYPWVVRHELALAPNSLPWPLARVIVDGPGLAYLHKACPDAHYALCDNLDGLPADDVEEFFWSPRSPVSSPKYLQIRRESLAILLGTIRMYPGWMLSVAMQHFVAQLLTIEATSVFGPVDEQKLDAAIPRALQAFQGTRQQRGLFDDNHLRPWNQLHGAIYGLAAIAATVLATRTWRRRDDRLLAVLATIAVALAANALATGVLSGVYGRYQGRIVWLLPFWVVLGVLSLRRRGVAAMPDTLLPRRLAGRD